MTKANPVCPFCKGAISKDLERYGGNCPHCLLEVPGDDAPTDPGLELRKKQEEEERLQAIARTRRNRLLMAVGAMMTMVVMSLGAWQYLAWKKSLEYDPQEYYQLPLEDLTIASADAPPAEADPLKVPGTAGTNGGTNGNPAGANNGGTDPVKNPGDPKVPHPPNNNGGNRDRPPVANGGNNGTPDQAAPELPDFGKQATVSIPSGGVASSSGNQTLSDRGEIEAMAARVIKVYNRQILTCYEQAVKQIPDLKGIWTVSFTITPGGTTDNIRVKGAGIANADMEACMIRSVGTWKFEKLSQEFKLAKQYRLSPSGW